jgi:hypothetical protein
VLGVKVNEYSYKKSFEAEMDPENEFGLFNDQNCGSLPSSVSRKYLYAGRRVLILICCLLFLFRFPTASGTITVISQLTNESVMEVEDEPARFVPDRVSFYGIQVSSYIVISS